MARAARPRRHNRTLDWTQAATSGGAGNQEWLQLSLGLFLGPYSYPESHHRRSEKLGHCPFYDTITEYCSKAKSVIVFQFAAYSLSAFSLQLTVAVSVDWSKNTGDLEINTIWHVRENTIMIKSI